MNCHRDGFYHGKMDIYAQDVGIKLKMPFNKGNIPWNICNSYNGKLNKNRNHWQKIYEDKINEIRRI